MSDTAIEFTPTARLNTYYTTKEISDQWNLVNNAITGAKSSQEFLDRLDNFWNSATILDIPIDVRDLTDIKINTKCDTIKVKFNNGSKVILNLDIPFGQFLDKIAPEKAGIRSIFNRYSRMDDTTKFSKKKALTYILKHMQDLSKKAKGRRRRLGFRMISHPKYFPNSYCGGIVNDKVYVPIRTPELVKVLRIFNEFQEFEVINPRISERGTSFGLALNSPAYQQKIAKVGDVVKGVIYMSNSQWGNRSLDFHAGTYVLSCSNGAISPKIGDGFHINHRKMKDMSIAETRNHILNDLFNKIEDMLKNFTELFSEMERSVSIEIPEVEEISEHPVLLQIQAICKEYSLGKNHEDVIWKAWKKEYRDQQNLWGLGNAFTYVANKTESLAMQEKLMRIGGWIFSLTQPRPIPIEVEA